MHHRWAECFKPSVLSVVGANTHLERAIRRETGSLDNRAPNILIPLFDSLTARSMPLYGYARKTTPNLEEIAETATVFHRHYAGGSSATPGRASLLTGTYPCMHRAHHFHGTAPDGRAENNLFTLEGAIDWLQDETPIFDRNCSGDRPESGASGQTDRGQPSIFIGWSALLAVNSPSGG